MKAIYRSNDPNSLDPMNGAVGEAYYDDDADGYTFFPDQGNAEGFYCDHSEITPLGDLMDTLTVVAESNPDSGNIIRLLRTGDQHRPYTYKVVIFDQLGQPNPTDWGNLADALQKFSAAVAYEELPCPHTSSTREDAGDYDDQGIRQTVDVCHGCGAILQGEQ